ncbi:hypothetical protein ACFRAR_35395 [Kitasatospora sp. NPDC056651]|uniref:hypothetical protein n=1 Tax=Kitasatospora sp. NPDC056651 TaxID=3345892 RepID=UPI0036C2541E
MATVFHPRTAEGRVVLAVLALVLVEVVVLGVAPSRERALLGAVLAGAAAGAFMVVAALLHGRRATRTRPHPHPHPAGEADGADGAGTNGGAGVWFEPGALDGFPLERVRPLLRSGRVGSVDQLYTGWVLATHGHDAAWIARHLDLPAEAAHLLVEAARHRPAPGTDPADPAYSAASAPGSRTNSASSAS